jgi:hypothetical protein
MTTLNLDPSSKAVLTKTDETPDPNTPGKIIPISYPCDLEGNRLTSDNPGLPIYRDLYSGKTYVRVAETIPTGTDQFSKNLADSITALKPIHYMSEDSSVRGYYVPAPDFNKREAESA